MAKKSWESNLWVWVAVMVGTTIVAGVATAYFTKIAGLKLKTAQASVALPQASNRGKYQASYTQ